MNSDASQYFEMRSPPGGPRLPLLVHVPHASIAVPAPWRETIALDDQELEAELLAMTDRHTDELFAAGPAREGILFVNRLSRLVFDPQRFPNDTEEAMAGKDMAAKGMDTVYTRTSGGHPLRALGFGVQDRAAIIGQLYEPYAAALADEVDVLLTRFGRCLIVDAHSFPTEPLTYEDPKLDRPDVCIGYDPFHCAEPVVKALEAVCREASLRPTRNAPFVGSYVPLRHHRKDDRVQSVMIELRRGLYMDEVTGERAALYPATMRLVTELLSQAVQAFETAEQARPGGSQASPTSSP